MMRKRIAALLAALACLAASFAFAGCGLTAYLPGAARTEYPSSEEYTAGEAAFTGAPTHLHIHWLAGSVTVTTHAEDTIEIRESANRELAETERVHWWYSETQSTGVALFIHYSASGKFDFGDLKKDLTIVLPQLNNLYIGATLDTADFALDIDDYANTLSKLSVTNNSGSVNVALSSADTVQISGAGDKKATGNVFSLTASGKIDQLGFNASFADMKADLNEVGTAEHVGTVKGTFDFSCKKIRALDAGIGGPYEKRLIIGSFNRLNVQNNAGDIILQLPPSAAFTLNAQCSGDPTVTGFADVRREGDVYVAGDGGKTIKLKTEGKASVIAAEPANDTQGAQSGQNRQGQN